MRAVKVRYIQVKTAIRRSRGIIQVSTVTRSIKVGFNQVKTVIKSIQVRTVIRRIRGIIQVSTVIRSIKVRFIQVKTVIKSIYIGDIQVKSFLRNNWVGSSR